MLMLARMTGLFVLLVFTRFTHLSHPCVFARWLADRSSVAGSNLTPDSKRQSKQASHRQADLRRNHAGLEAGGTGDVAGPLWQDMQKAIDDHRESQKDQSAWLLSLLDHQKKLNDGLKVC